MNKKIKYISAVLCLLSIILNLWGVSASVFASENGAKLRLTSLKAGNVFFDGDIPSVGIILKNSSIEEKEFIIEYSLKRKNYSEDESFTEVKSGQYSKETLSGGESIKRVFECDEDIEYGIYNLSISIKNVGNTSETLCSEEMQFSKVIRNNTQNPNHGICVHLVRMGDAETELSFAKNAGFSMIRDDFSWQEYEVKPGNRGLSSRHRDLLRKAEKYNLDILAVVGGGHTSYETDGRDYGLPKDMEGFAAFVDSLTKEDRFNTIKKIELQNEPQRGYVSAGVQDLNSLVPLYGNQLITASKVIRENRPDIEIGALSVCLTYFEQTEEYISRTLAYLEENYNQEKPIFDTISIHPYTARPGMTIGETAERYKTVAKENGFDADNTDIWISEYGLNTGQLNQEEYISELEQAKRIINDYAQMKALDFNDDLYIYDLTDDGQTFGLLRHSSEAELPYAAKLSYLAVSALNKMAGGAIGCTADKDENNLSDVYDFSYSDGNVYMIYPKTEGDTDIVYNFGKGTLRYYDILGNEINKDKSNEYFKTKIPYYVTRNMEIKPTEDSIFTISGNINSGLPDKNISLTVLKEQTVFDAGMHDKIQYAEQKKTEENGSFEFKFDVDDKTENLIGYVVSEDNPKHPLEFMLKGDIKALRLYSGATEINSLNLDLLNMSEARVVINFTDVENVDKFKLICGFYNEDRLVYSKICNKEDGNESNSYDISTDESFECDYVKIFMFDSLTDCVPICSATKFGQN